LGGDVVFAAVDPSVELALREELAIKGHASLGLRNTTRQIYYSAPPSQLAHQIKTLLDPDACFPDLFGAVGT